MPSCLGRSYYERDTTEVAKSLLGKVLVRNWASPRAILRLSGYIIETEAYGGRDDPASHAFNGLRPRNSVMFGNVGCLYVYLIYGKHFCANVTARDNDAEAGAVLIRAIIPKVGRVILRHHKNSIIGPGRVAEAMSITLAHNGLDVTLRTSPISVHQGLEVADFITSKRVGISKAVDKPWRYAASNLLLAD